MKKRKEANIFFSNSNLQLSRSHHIENTTGYNLFACELLLRLQPEDNEIESIRLRTNGHELIAAKEGRYILVVLCDGFTSGKDHEASDDDLGDANVTKIISS